MMKANGTNNGCSRLSTPLAATTTLEDPGTPASWKGPPAGSEASPYTPNSVNQGGPSYNTSGPGGNPGGFQGPSPFPGGAGSPAGGPGYQGPPPGSGTPQYTASPAPSGSSTPGPGPQSNPGFPPPQNNSGPYNGPGPSPFGSPSGPPQFVGRPGSSGPPFVPPGGNPHFPSPGQFSGPQYGMPPGSPFGPGHPMGPMGPGHPMMGPGGPVDRMDQGLPAPQPPTTPTHGPPTPHGPVGPHLNGASPSPHPMPHMMQGSPHHMGPGAGGGPSPHPHHHMVGSPHHHMATGGSVMPGGPGTGPGPGPGGGMMAPGIQQGPMCPPGAPGPMGPHHQAPPGQHMHNDPFYCSPFGSPYYRSLPVPRRHTPYFQQPDIRLYELNKRLQSRTEESDNLWWDSFATEFFEDDATLTLAFCLEDGPKRYTIGRTLIPRYFRSIFEGGVTELYYHMKHPKESFHNTSITLDCEHCVMVTHHGKPPFMKVCTEGRLILEFTFDDLMRIKSWHMNVRTHRELVPRSVVSMHTAQQDPSMLEQLTKNITRQGITNSTLNYLRLCVILEPMQELMSRHKAYQLTPRDCLKTTLFQKWQRMDVMVVGEPSLMGGEFGEEDERLITRLENAQYDASNSIDQHGHDNSGGGPPPHPHQFHSEPTPGNSWPPDRGPGPPQGGPGNQVQGNQGGAGVQGPPDSNQQQDKKSPAVSQ
ncbi:Similar to LDB2: LIM domain-binding protein 2 (Gallus gallus) [Cotesia congregata]|uniref:Similar to LDB2: LIM domain-binding protein 2 (Gallus gallus) n=1 Tax=Cotesia congregata TaxID=51543 RepID=A0A8J2H541_COTCN|nr:Similar to LDB2: LIM domain-binding protein 2 (Gallus gallus) [Cotesia congregata]